MKLTEAIKVVRFPLIVLVVYIHSIDYPIGDWNYINSAGQPIYTLLNTNIPFLISDTAVPIFFMISGYLFFLKHSDSFTKEDWKRQISKRFYTLFIPYVTWNTLSYLATVLKRNILPSTVADDPHAHFQFFQDFVTIYWDLPIDYPLWYVRELIILALLSPLFYHCIKKIPYVVMPLVTVYYLFFVGVDGFHPHAVFYFSVGAYLAIHKHHELTIPTKWIAIAGLLALGLGVVHILNPIPSIRRTTIEGLYFISAITFLCGWLFKQDLSQPLFRWFDKMGKYVFFIFALHNIYLINFARGFKHKLMGLTTGFASELIGILAFLVLPWVVMGICIVIYELLDRVAPGLLRFLNGGRKMTKSK